MSSYQQFDSLIADATLDDPDFILIEYIPPGHERGDPVKAAEIIGDRGPVPHDGFVMFMGCLGTPASRRRPRSLNRAGFGRCPGDGCTIPLAPQIARERYMEGFVHPADGDAPIGVCPKHERVTIVDYKPCGYRRATVMDAEDELVGYYELAPHLVVGSDAKSVATGAQLPHPAGVLATWRPIWAAPPPPPGATLREYRRSDFW